MGPIQHFNNIFNWLNFDINFETSWWPPVNYTEALSFGEMPDA